MDRRPSPGTAAGGGAAAVVAALIAIMFMGSTLLTPLYVLYQKKLGFSQVTLTLIYASYVVGNLAALLLFGRLSDLVGRRRVALAAIGLAGVGTLLFLLAGGTGWLFWARATSGLAIGLASGAAAAWLVDLGAADGRDSSRASLVATSANMIGLAAGALVGGVLARYAPAPLRLPFIIYLVALAAIAPLIWRTRETVVAAAGHGAMSLRPRLGVPADVRVPFLAPAATAFGTFGLLGFYGALIPSVLAADLGVTSSAVGGAVVTELCAVAAIAVVATRRLASRTAMVGGLVLLVPAAWLLVAAQALASMPILVAGTALSGVASALGYRGGLQRASELAPADRRGEVVSSYFVVCYAGNSLPVIGVGLVSRAAGPIAASSAFGATITAFALAALLVAFRSRSSDRGPMDVEQGRRAAQRRVRGASRAG
ncbi:MAG TPA: MFS transporter [Kofleriaceae bacterium]|nr:MFS transporter [Kofleriaceae bacterium]